MNMNTLTESSAIPSPALIKPRCPRIARQLAWCSPGLGHMYAGSLIRGLWFMSAAYLPVCIAIVAIYRNSANWPLLVIGIVISAIVCAWSVWDAIKVTRLTRADYRLKDYNRISAYLLLFLVPNITLGLALVTVILTFMGIGLRSAVDTPALGFLKGDQMFCSKLAYRSQPPAKDDRIAFYGTPTSTSIRIGQVLAVAGETIPDGAGITVVPPEHVWILCRANDGSEQRRLVSHYAVKGKIVFRYLPIRRFGKIAGDPPN